MRCTRNGCSNLSTMQNYFSFICKNTEKPYNTIGFPLIFILLQQIRTEKMKYFKTKFTFRVCNGNGTAQETTLDTARELCAAIAGYAGYESFEDTDEGINGYIQQDIFDNDTLDAALADFPLEGIEVQHATEVAEDKNWNEEWEKQGFDPITVDDRCCIHDICHNAPAQFPIDVEIDARQAFGTGTHNTTRMIVGELLGMDLHGKRVLDCGCGTGILSIVAAKCGAASVTGYDIDEWSADNTRHNAAINRVENIEVLLGDASVLAHVEGRFDLVLANINRNILLADMPKMERMMDNGAKLILSGFYAEDVPMLRSKAEVLGLEYESQHTMKNWTMLRFNKK